MDKETFRNWIKNEWTNAGGLITPATAMNILGITSGGIANFQKEGKVTTFKNPNGKTLLSYAEIMKLAEERTINGVKRGRKRKKRPYTVSEPPDEQNPASTP